jgi:hypothetical protein
VGYTELLRHFPALVEKSDVDEYQFVVLLNQFCQRRAVQP